MNHNQTVRPLLFAMLASLSGASQAVSFTHNDITLDINGTINGFYVNREAQSINRATGASTTTNNSELTNGLLPGWINFVATTQANGQDIKAHFSFAPGINNNSQTVGLPIGNNAGGAGTTNPYSQIDTRNVYFQFGNSSWGTLKFGRDIGLFGQNIILSDMTLIGVGGTSNAGIPYNTTFGMIGHGYMYTGFQPQITYTTPNLNGLQAAIGIFQPSKFAGDETKAPGIQGMASYDWKGSSASGKLWTGFVSQTTSCSVSPCSTSSFSANGFELGAKAGFGNFEAVAYAFTGSGLGLSTVGMIGHGYMYTGFQPQITYTTPNYSGLQASVGIFQPSKFAGDETETPGVQGMASYDWKGSSASGKLWTGFVSQTTSCSVSPCATSSFSANGFELGAKAGFGNFEAVAYVFTGSGLGLSTVGAQFYGGSNGAGNKTDSEGYFLQGTYKFGDTKVGLNYGENKDKNGYALTGASSMDNIKNRAYTLGVYHSLNKYITLVGEFNDEKVTNVSDTNYDNKNRTLSFGGLIFF